MSSKDEIQKIAILIAQKLTVTHSFEIFMPNTWNRMEILRESTFLAVKCDFHFCFTCAIICIVYDHTIFIT